MWFEMIKRGRSGLDDQKGKEGLAGLMTRPWRV